MRRFGGRQHRPRGDTPVEDAEIGSDRLSSTSRHHKSEWSRVHRMAQRMVRVLLRTPKLRVSVPLNLRVRPDQPERMREVAVLGRSGEHLAVEGAGTVPPTVALILEPELRQH